MKAILPIAALALLAACSGAPADNNMQGVAQDVAANNMVTDDVTEVPDDSASAPPAESAAPADAPEPEKSEAAKRESGVR